MSNKVVPIDPRQAELADRMLKATPGDGVHPTALDALAFIRTSEVMQPLPGIYSPCLCVVIQGRKRAIVGNQSYYYDPFNYVIVSVTLPVLSQVLDATPERPYLCIRVNVDVPEVSRLLLELNERALAETESSDVPFYVARMQNDLLDVLLRLVRLLDAPADLPVLAPLALREIWYRLLRGEMSGRLRQLVAADGTVQRISRAIELLKKRFDQPLRIEALAEASHMSLSTFHTRFKAVTSLSPLQFQKQLRLHEARRLLMADGMEAAAVAHRVGYESPSQFSREYRRLFGAPPRQEVAALRTTSAVR